VPGTSTHIEEDVVLKQLALAASLAPIVAAFGQSQSASPRTTVPVKRVVLFSSGVGYYEHDGTVHGDVATELRFRADQISDVLKSLVLQDRDGGHVAAVTYPSQAPISKTLKSFQVDITNNPSLADLLNQLRGARVTVQAPGEHISGTILGVESRRKAAGAGEPIVVATLDLLAGGTLRAIELPSVTGLSFDDPQLEDELTKALAALAQARDQDKKPVTVDFNGSGDRRVRIGYVVEAPVWKTSYRLLLGDTHHQLQGWAIVENQTESDWSDASLSLVSGRPISFAMDLYQPLYATRPTVVPKLFAGLHPQLYENGMPTRVDSVAMQPGSSARRANSGFPAVTVRGPAQLSEVVVTATGNGPGDQSVQAVAQAADLGELFEYSVGNVTLPRQKSAMLPIIVDSVGVDRVSIFNPSVLPRNALTGVRLTNSTGKLLLQGPITVLDHNTYAGDARIDDVPRGQQRLISYGVDLQLVVEVTPDTHADRLVSARIVKGVLQVQTRQLYTRSYRAQNSGDRDKTLIVEHLRRPDFNLVDTQRPLETLPNLYRFEGVAPAGKVATLTVKEEYVSSSGYGLLGNDYGTLLSSWRSGELPVAVRDALAKAAQLRQAVMDTEREINEHVQRLAQITQEQTRIREDMKTVSANTPYYARLLAKLNDQESEIEKLQRERDELAARRDAQRHALDEYVMNLDVV
jgi:hypothetical protein